MLVHAGAYALPLQGPLLKTDAEALAYCKATPNTYVVIIWPKGYSHLGYAIKKLNQHGSVKYIKKMVINRGKMFALYRSVHKSMSYASAKKYFKPYTAASACEPLHIAALVYRTDASLEEIIELKKNIRDFIGESFCSIHINDYYDPGTLEAAVAVFKT
jgi:hypothetical protein